MLELHSVLPQHPRTQLISPFSFKITLDSRLNNAECEFSIVYGGSPNTDIYDQTLIRTLIGPIPEGRIQFDLDCDPVEIQKLSYIFGITSLIIIGKYKEKEFIRVGYFVKVEYPEIRMDLLEDEVMKDTIEDYSEGIIDAEERSEEFSEYSEEDSESSEEECIKEDLPKLSVENVDEENKDENLESLSENDKNEDEVDNPKASIDSAQLVDSNALVNILTSPTLKKIKNLENVFLENEAEIQNEEVDFVSNESEEREEIDAMLAEKTGITIVEDKLYVKDLVLNINEITVEFCEPPLVTPFVINWSENGEESDKNDVCIDEDPEEQKSLSSDHDTDSPKKRKLD